MGEKDVFDIETGRLVIPFPDMGKTMGKSGLNRKGKGLLRIC